MVSVSNKINTVKNFIECQLEHFGISYETWFEEDDTLGGYCYMICTDDSAILFSDNTDDGSLQIFQLNAKLLEWADDEGLTNEQRNGLNCYTLIPRICDALDILTNNEFSKQ